MDMRLATRGALLMLGGALGGGWASADVAYRETFPTGDSVEASGWRYHVGDKAHDHSNTAAWGGAAGATSEPAVNSSPADESAAWKGFVWLAHGDRYVLWTREAAITAPVRSIGWHMTLGPGADDAVRVVVQVDADRNGPDDKDPWFASDQAFTQTRQVEGVDKAPATVLKFEKAKWRRFDYVPGDPSGGGRIPDEPGDLIELPAGDFGAFGLWGQKKTATHVFDTFTVDTTANRGEGARVTDPPYPKAPAVAQDAAPRPPKLGPPITNYQFNTVAIGGGGYFTGLYIHPRVPDMMWTRSDVQGPWKRSAADDRWRIMTFAAPMDVPSNCASAVAMDPRDPNVVYAELGGGRFNMGLYKSTDGGGSWTRLIDAYASSNEGEERHWGEALHCDPNNPDVVYWGSRKNGIVRSTDAGKTWQTVREPAKDDGGYGTRSLAIDPTKRVAGRSQNLYASVAGKGMIRSTDGGDTWQPMSEFAALAAAPTEVCWLTVDKEGVLYVAHNKGLARFDEAGGWRDIGQPGMLNAYGVDVDRDDPRRIVAIGNYRFPDDPKRQGWAVFRSTDGGATWITPAVNGWGKVPNGLLATAKHDRWWFGAGLAPFGVTLDPHHPGRAYMVDAFGIWRCDDVFAERTEWDQFSQGAENIVTIMLRTPPDVAGRPEVVAPLYSGVSDVRGFRHDSPDVVPATTIAAPGEWVTYVNGLDHCESQPNVMMACKFGVNNESIVLRSTDAGRNWSVAGNPMPNKNHGGAKVAISATDPDRAVFLPGAGNRPLFTTDGGQSWRPSKVAGDASMPAPDFSEHDFAYNFAYVISADRVDGDTFYAVRNRDSTMWVSRDGGATWAPTCDLPDANAHDDQAPVYVVAKPGIAGEVWVTLGMNGIYRSTDYGKTFARVPQFQGSRPVQVAFGKPAPDRPDSEPTIYVMGKAVGDDEFGIYRSTDDGESWQVIDRSLHRHFQSGQFVADRQVFGRVYLGSTGIYYAQLNDHAPTLELPATLAVEAGSAAVAVVTVADAETDAEGIVVRVASSSDATLLPVTAATLEPVAGKPGERRLSVRAAAGATGSTELTIEAADGNLTGWKTTRKTIRVTVE